MTDLEYIDIMGDLSIVYGLCWIALAVLHWKGLV